VQLAEDADVSSGDIVIQAVTGQRRMSLVLDWYAKALGLRPRDEKLREFRGGSFLLETRPRQEISVDGEVCARTPARIGVAPGTVLVAAPA
jgi:diacylglycerol kinase family enzyme